MTACTSTDCLSLERDRDQARFMASNPSRQRRSNVETRMWLVHHSPGHCVTATEAEGSASRSGCVPEQAEHRHWCVTYAPSAGRSDVEQFAVVRKNLPSDDVPGRSIAWHDQQAILPSRTTVAVPSMAFATDAITSHSTIPAAVDAQKTYESNFHARFSLLICLCIKRLSLTCFSYRGRIARANVFAKCVTINSSSRERRGSAPGNTHSPTLGKRVDGQQELVLRKGRILDSRVQRGCAVPASCAFQVPCYPVLRP